MPKMYIYFWTLPYFEPYFDYDEEAPLERDYDSLIEEETDPEERGTSSSNGVPADIIAQLNDIIRQRDAEIAALKQQHSKDENTFIQLRKILDKHFDSDEWAWNLWYWGSVYAGDGYSILELLPYVNSHHGLRRKVAGWSGLYRAAMIDYIQFA